MGYNAFGYKDCFLYQHILKPTRARGDATPHILDLVLTNEEGMVSTVEYSSLIGKSDHCVISFTFKCYVNRSVSCREKFYYDRGDYSGMGALVRTVDWNATFNGQSMDEKWKSFKNIIGN